MINFEYWSPTKVIFGKETELRVGAEVKTWGGTKVLVHYGSESAKKSGLIDKVCNSLKAEGIAYITLGGVVPNPRLSLVREGAALCKKEKVDFILAVGGGSVIDSAKGIGYGMTHECDVWDIYEKKVIPTVCAPIGVVLTIAAAGSETSDSSVITNEDGWLKRAGNYPCGRCKFAIMNPELTYTLPKYQTASGCADILMHTMERYFTNVKNVELIDKMSEGLMKAVLNNTRILMENPTDYDARAEVMWAGSLSHNGLTGTGRVGDFASHQLEHELGGMFDVAHGAGLAAVWGSWARYVYKDNIARFAQFAVNVMGCDMNFDTPEATALMGIEAMEQFYKEIEMPTSVSQMGISMTDAQIEELAYKCTFGETRTIGQFKVLDKQDIIAIYKMAR